MKYSVEGQINIFDEICQPAVKIKNTYSIYAVPKRYDGSHIETLITAYTEKQARFLFYKTRPEYLITGIYQVV